MKPWHKHIQSDSLLWLIFTGAVLCKHKARTWDLDTAACTKFKWEKRPGYCALSDEPVVIARDAKRVIIISTSCKGNTLDFQKSGITPCAYLCFFFFLIFFFTLSKQTSLTSWQVDNASWAWVLFNRAALVVRKQGQYAVGSDKLLELIINAETFCSFCHMNTTRKLQQQGLDQHLMIHSLPSMRCSNENILFP